MEISAPSSNTNAHEKIRRVLKKFLEPNFSVKNDVLLNLFIKHLIGNDENGKIVPKIMDKQLKDEFSQWIIQATDLWYNSKVRPPTAILTFGLNLTSHLNSDEHTFVNLNGNNVYEKLVGVAQRYSSDKDVTHGMLTLLCSFLEHKSGVQWVMATTYWTDVINLGLTAQTIDIRHKACLFLTKLLEKNICFNKKFAVNLVGILLKPLKDLFRSLLGNKDVQSTQIEDAELKSLEPILELISEVTLMLLKSSNNDVLDLFIEQGTPEMIARIVLLSQKEDFSFTVLKVQFVFLFYKLCNVKDVLRGYNDLRIMFDFIQKEMDRNNVRCVIQICDFGHDLYCSLSSRMPACVRSRNEELVDFQSQMILLQLMPLLALSLRIKAGQGKENEETDLIINNAFRKRFIQGLFKVAVTRNIELCFKWKISLQGKPDLMEDATISLEYLVKGKRFLNKKQVCTIFPALVYALSDSLTVVKAIDHMDWSPRCVNYLRTLMTTIIDFVESFDLTWQDSIETIRVMDLACAFLQFPNWPDKVVVHGLKLLKTAISKYMSPDMLLLICSTEDSTVSKSANLLFVKCQVNSWEVRDSALETVYTLALNANTEFPSLTNVLLAAKLPWLVVHMALKDSESFVRATAMRCLQELIQLSDVWDVLLDIDEFLDDILNVFESETEGKVRKEAATLVSKIYREQGFPDDLLPRLYDVMTHAATEDLHWEVKYNAVEFWFQTWKVHLMNQGMIDRAFPTHTFSKENKKIVTLNEAEVRKRIIKVLNQLSEIGCLHVMKCAIQNTSDIEISKTAIFCHAKILNLLRKYKVPSENIDLIGPSNSMTLDSSPSPHPYEPISPVSSIHLDAESPANIKSAESKQSENIQYFDPFSPFPSPLSLSVDQMKLADSPALQPSSSKSSQSSQTPASDYYNSDLDRYLAAQTPSYMETDHLRIDQDPLLIDSSMFDVKMLGEKNEQIKEKQGQNLVTSRSTKMKTKEYLAPSHYLKFIYDAETLAEEKTRQLNSLDEFDSLLNDILEEYV